jgi:hypothetical protein
MLRERGTPLTVSAIRPLMADIGNFAGTGSRTLRPYQLACARAVIDSVVHRRGQVFTVMFARQMGKNETSAQIEAYLLALYAARGGSLVKGAPSFKPQVINSIIRLRAVLDANPLTRGRSHSAHGYMVGVGRAFAAFYSADTHANVVGATASLLLEIDEAQDVDPDKYDRDFRPMASSSNATTVLYGTAWGEDSILERQRRHNLEHQRETGQRLHFEYDWSTLGAISPAYREFVQAEQARLGVDHPTFQTQYLLHCIADAGKLFSGAQCAALEGAHGRQRTRRQGEVYVAGIDLAGEDEQAQDAVARALSPKRDSTVVTIAEVTRDGNGCQVVTVVDHVWWTGRSQVSQFEQLLGLFQQWDFARVAVDATGVGAGIASFLTARFGARVDPIVFTAPVKSSLAYLMLGMINTSRLALYASDGSPERVECGEQIRKTRYRTRDQEQLQWGVPPQDGHDDFVVSLALCCRAAEDRAPVALGGLVRPTSPGDDGW